ncbi:uncharacterized protein PFL1_06713 [Pseudozyma flocculosa PF-1]|uniref:Uncharacterized protein n=2 Tax=Pseudozyma flocculosa TaxID=84751 RepID=A0A5C3F4P1_9BASI|nr:uncharacterized protein PFL1_06713 [Pseudozyma flocculosa PF-1]EPQ25719.1 hypothetical protein PFL1_06713 [Pseudozyma flocculosa PF-1]SPO38905.1 uncharacterized protein PSFLO_04384 [Pseudozyma flocculosa]
MTFTPNPHFDRDSSNPKDWAYQLGMLPSSAAIVFTKADFINFLKQHNVHVGPNFTELAKLPKYARIGKLTDEAAPSQPAAAQPASQQATSISARSAPATASAPAPSDDGEAASRSSANVVYTSSGEVFRPTRKVRELPGGGSAQITSLFGNAAADVDERPIKPASRQPHYDARDEAENIPPAPAPAVTTRPIQSQVLNAVEPDTASASVGKYEGVPNDAKSHNGFRPTRRVRVPGGTGGASSICFD